MQYRLSTFVIARRTAGCLVAVAILISQGHANANEGVPYASEVVPHAGGEIVSDSHVSAGTYVGDISSCDAGCCDGSCDGAGCCEGGGHGLDHLRGMFASLFGHGHRGGSGVIGRSYGKPDLFYNFYTQGYANRTNAQMYLSPVPVPPNVGHTFYTYQPFYPHHMMYWHQDKFHRYYDHGRGMNRTKASYWSPPLRQAMSNLYWNCIRIPR